MTRLTSNRSRRRLGVATAAVVSAALLTGCGQMTNPYTTDLHYNAADGVSASVGGLNAENLLVVNDGKAATGTLHGLVYNPSSSDSTVSFTLGNTTKDVTVPAGHSVRLDGKANGNNTATVPAVVLPTDGTKPGDVAAMTVKSGSATSEVQVPVLLDQSPYGSASASHPADEQPAEKHDTAIVEESAHSE